MEPFDCEDHGDPIQVLKYDGAETYSVRELELETGDYELLYRFPGRRYFAARADELLCARSGCRQRSNAAKIIEDGLRLFELGRRRYELDWFDGHVNAAGMLYDQYDEQFYAVASFGGYLCRFGRNVRRAECFSTPLEESKPNVGTVLVNRYYYAKDPGRNGEKPFYWVDGADSDAPVFHANANFVIREDLYTDAVLDVAAIRENYTDSGPGRTGLTIVNDFVQDGVVGADYLIGLGEQAEVLIVYVDRDSGEPTKYAVLPSALDHAGANAQTGDQQYGAAWTYLYVDPATGAYDLDVLFGSNDGAGIFKASLPIAVPESCWNAGSDTSDHAFCETADAVELVRVASSDDVRSNDGLNCPFPANREPTAKPTAFPTNPTASPAKAPTLGPTTRAPTTAGPPAPTSGPSPTASPTICEDSAEWYKGGANPDANKDCPWVSQYAEVRCAVVGMDGSLASQSCPATCGTCGNPAPTAAPEPTASPAIPPSPSPIPAPTPPPSPVPGLPTASPFPAPVAAPTSNPTSNPTTEFPLPTGSPTIPNTPVPTVLPTPFPTGLPTTGAPVPRPTVSPSVSPSVSPTSRPTTGSPAPAPTASTDAPVPAPTAAPVAGDATEVGLISSQFTMANVTAAARRDPDALEATMAEALAATCGSVAAADDVSGVVFETNGFTWSSASGSSSWTSSSSSSSSSSSWSFNTSATGAGTPRL